MILADKIMMLRKKNGWSQEELAEQLNVTRQSVSKWEGAQSTPDLDRILKMSQIFGVSTDYLLKDEQEEEEYVETTSDSKARRVSMEEANEFLSVKKWSAKKVAWAVFLYIISPACMLFLGAAAELGVVHQWTGIVLKESVAGGIGLIVLLIIIAVATAICIYVEGKTKPFEYIEKELIETEYGVSGMVRERQKQFKDTYYRWNIIGTCLCILAVIPLFVVGITNENEVAVVFALPILLILVGIGVTFFIRAGIPWATMEKLLQEGEYSAEAKSKNKDSEPIVTVYWTIVTAIFFIYSFGFDEWGKSWIIWPVAGVLFAAFMAVYRMIKKK